MAIISPIDKTKYKNNLPKTVKIGPLRYQIIRSDSFDMQSTEMMFGLISTSNQKIYVKKSIPDELADQVLWHEIIHGILQQSQFDEQNNNEPLVDVLAFGITQILHSNPKIGRHDAS